jgi:oxygen-independent coproporphyrinogen-3 oxidase
VSAGCPDAVTSLYVHVPFCARKCEYCAFYSEASSGEVVNRYVAALIRELELIAGDLRPRTIFFGGGTPSLLNLKQWQKILGAMEQLDLLGAEEWSIECNPATVSLDKARLWRDYGVNRVSMGVQSFNEDLLDRLGRIHSREMVFRSFDLLRQGGFENINVDLMFAIPGQTMQVCRDSLDEAMALGSEHLSCYEVIYEEDTPLFEQLKAGQFSVDEELACAMYEELVGRTSQKGFVQYEVANFARSSGPAGANSLVGTARCAVPAPFRRGTERRLDEELAGTSSRSFHSVNADRDAAAQHPYPSDQETTWLAPRLACRHNVNYWRGGSYYGLGPSAAGYVRGVRTKNWANTRLYCEQLEQGRRAIESREELPPLQRAGETAAFGLRMNAGWDFESFRRVTGFDLRAGWSNEIDDLIARGWGVVEERTFHLTRQGLRFADAAAEMFLRSEAEREQPCSQPECSGIS